MEIFLRFICLIFKQDLRSMNFKLTQKILAAFGVISTVLAGTAVSAIAQTCEPLEVVGEEGTEVTKTVSVPGFLLIDTNWNTDFIVPSNESYDYFVVNFLPQDGESYDVDVHLKYPDDSMDTAYSVRDSFFPEEELVTIEAASRFASDPYQINIRIGGLNAEGNTYTTSVMGCQ